MDRTKRVFDYQTMAERYKVKPDVLKQLVDEARREFAQDEMMVELHVKRLRIIWDGRSQPENYPQPVFG